MQTPVQDRREMMINQLLMRGHATMKEILTVAFGEWPPKGLDMNPGITHEQTITFKPITDWIKESNMSPEEERKTLNEWLGFGRLNRERIIFFNYLLINQMEQVLPGRRISNMSHEAFHVLQGDHSYRAAETFNKAFMDVPCSQVLMEKLADCFNESSDEDTLYGRNGIEMQARLHEIVIEVYRKRGRLPLNCDEFWTAIMLAGISPPPDIVDHLSSLAVRSATQVFANIKFSDMARDRASKIQLVNGSLSSDGQDKFWREILPALYADLLEMYGDKLGRERFFPSRKNPKRNFVQRKEPGTK